MVILTEQVVLTDQVLLEKFLCDLKEGTQCWVKSHLLQNCEEVLCLTEVFAVSEGDYIKERPLSSSMGSGTCGGDNRWVPSKG